jgi:tRNA modification GTPase
MRLQPFKDSLVEIIVRLESSLEFVEDDLPELALEGLRRQLEDLIQNLETLARSFHSGRLLKDGLKVTLVGRPNAGKSSVFNNLLTVDRAIVTDIPGTTRDSLSELLNLEGVPVLVTDTAGVRTAEDPIEHLGIERTRQAMADADLIVAVVDGSRPLTYEDESLLAELPESCYLIVLGVAPIPISARTGAGFDQLRRAILAPFTGGGFQNTDFLITNARHSDLLRRAADSLRSSRSTIGEGASEDLILVGLYDSLRFLGEITGETTPDDVLTQIFATFCIGK